MPIRAIMFDLDGTLIDQFDAIHRTFSKVLVDMGYPAPSYDAVKKAVGGASETTMTKLIGKERAPEAVQRLRPIFEKEMLIGLRALPGSMEILELCDQRKIKTGVLTNKHGPHARVVCDHLGFSKFLSFTIGANDTEWKKPDSKLSMLALKRLDSLPHETIYLGDSPYDYETALNAGMIPYLVATGTHSHEELRSLKNVHIETNVLSFIENIFPSIFQ
tara:strand:+ start:5221 stop:5874 length:654 start_codon:yes stop_codon:yes gene_type:complete